MATSGLKSRQSLDAILARLGLGEHVEQEVTVAEWPGVDHNIGHRRGASRAHSFVNFLNVPATCSRLGTKITPAPGTFLFSCLARLPGNNSKKPNANDKDWHISSFFADRSSGESFLSPISGKKSHGASSSGDTCNATRTSSRGHGQKTNLSTSFGDAAEIEMGLEHMETKYAFIYRIWLYGGFFISVSTAAAFEKSSEGRADMHAPMSRTLQPLRWFTNNTRSNDTAQDTDEGGLRLVGDQVGFYNHFMLLHPFNRLRHTIFDDAAVWGRVCEALSTFFGVAIITFESGTTFKHYMWPFLKDFTIEKDVPKRLVDFVKTLLAFCSFFLGFYTSVTLTRWNGIFWNDGILRIFRGSEKITMMIACDAPETWVETTNPDLQPVTIRRSDIVALVPRWSRASLCIIFEVYGRGRTNEVALEHARRANLLTDEEITCLRLVPNDHCLVLWSWIFKLICKLSDKKLIKIAFQPYHIMHNEAFFGVVNLMEHSRHPLPFAYTSMISIFVTCLNIFTAGVGGALFTRSLFHYDELEALVQLSGVFITNTITNAVMVFNVNMANPLQDIYVGESVGKLHRDLGNSGEAINIATASANLPPMFGHQWALPSSE